MYCISNTLGGKQTHLRCISALDPSRPATLYSSRTCCMQLANETDPDEYQEANIVNTIPPLRISRARRGTAPDQKVKIPSSLKILAAQTKLFL